VLNSMKVISTAAGVLRRPILAFGPELLAAIRSAEGTRDFFLANRVLLAGLEYSRSGVLDGLVRWTEISEPQRRRVYASLVKYALRASGRPTPHGYFAGVSSLARESTVLRVPEMTHICREPRADAPRAPERHQDGMDRETADLVLNPTFTAAGDWAAYYEPSSATGVACPSIARMVRLGAADMRLRQLDDASSQTQMRESAEFRQESILLPQYPPCVIESGYQCITVSLEESIDRLVPTSFDEVSSSRTQGATKDAAVQCAFSTSQAEVPHGLVRQVRLAAAAVASLVAAEDPLETFRNRFRDRYDTAFVPLVMVASHEFGIGSDGSTRPSRGLAPAPSWNVDARIASLALSDDVDLAALALDTNDVALRDPHRYVNCKVVSQGSTVLHTGFLGSGANPIPLLARVARYLPDVADLVRSVCDEQQRFVADGDFLAEVVFLTDSVDGNAAIRVPTYASEICLFGHGRKNSRKFHPSDLVLGLVNGVFELRDVASGARIIPRLSTMQNFLHPQTPFILQILGALQYESQTPGVAWTWGSCEHLPRLPRVKFGDVVVSPRTWNPLCAEAFKKISSLDGLKRWCSQLQVPRFVVLHEAWGDSLPLDLDAQECQTILALACKNARESSSGLSLSEADYLFAGERSDVVVSEVIALCQRQSTTEPSESRHRTPGGKRRGQDVARTGDGFDGAMEAVLAPAAPSSARVFFPGEEWSYVRIYAGPQTIDSIVGRILPDLRQHLAASGGAWDIFYLRYSDPDTHLRVRFRGAARATSTVLARLLNIGRDPYYNGRVHKIELSTYTPETDAYGPGAALESWHQWFTIDSLFCASLVRRFDSATWDARIPLSILWLSHAAELMGLSPPPPGAQRLPRGLLLRVENHLGMAKLHFSALCRRDAVFEMRSEFASAASLFTSRLLGHGMPRDAVAERLFHLHANRLLPDVPSGVESALALAVSRFLGWLRSDPRNSFASRQYSAVLGDDA
jgi:Lantibiotic dehydratase, N terminus/Lantibiotic biosynthesis dehydratase C-term